MFGCGADQVAVDSITAGETTGHSSTSESGESGSTDTGTDTGGTDTDVDTSECYGGESIGFGSKWGSLQPVVRDEEFWQWSVVHELACTVATLAPGDPWVAQLSCDSEGVTLDLEWRVPESFGLLDLGWQDRPLSVVAEGAYHPVGSQLEGWMVMRDELGELVWISTGPSIPEPEWTEPLTIEIIETGENCVLDDDPCYPVYAHPVLFSSPVDGELRAYAGQGHVTDSYVYLADSTTYVDNWLPLSDECDEIFDKFFGRWTTVRVVRRP